MLIRMFVLQQLFRMRRIQANEMQNISDMHRFRICLLLRSECVIFTLDYSYSSKAYSASCPMGENAAWVSLVPCCNCVDAIQLLQSERTRTVFYISLIQLSRPFTLILFKQGFSHTVLFAGVRSQNNYNGRQLLQNVARPQWPISMAARFIVISVVREYSLLYAPQIDSIKLNGPSRAFSHIYDLYTQCNLATFAFRCIAGSSSNPFEL